MNIPNLENASVGFPVTRLGVSFFPVYLRNNDLPEIATGPESGLVVEELEKAMVPTLRAKNPTDKPILIVEGEHFVGGDQNRASNVSLLVGAGTDLEIPVSCLERERWGRRREYERSMSYAPRNVRARQQETVNLAFHEEGSRRSDQGAVWNEVDQALHRLNVTSETAAAADLEEVYTRDRFRYSAAEELAQMGPLAGQCGFVVTHGGWVRSVELFGSEKLLAAHWSRLVRPHLLEVPQKPAGPSSDAALWAIRRFASMPSESRPGVGLGTEHRATDGTMSGQALILDESIAHASAFLKT